MQELSKQRNAAQEEKELLDNQVATLQRNLKELEVEVGSLQDQLFEVTAERDQKRRLCLEQSERLSHLQEQTKFSDQQLSKKLSEMKEEYELIKEQVVNIMKQKVSLWEENLDLQNDLALHLSRTWADETLVCLDIVSVLSIS
jgi:chromosome segregation ATPase